MRAIVNRIELRVLEILLESIVNTDNHVFGKVTTRHARLVRDHNREPIIIVQNTNCLRRIRKHTKARRMIDVTNLFGNGAIAIDENCGTLLHGYATESHKLLTVLAKLPR